MWRQWYASDAAQSVLVPRVDLSTVADGDVASAIAEWGEVAQRSLDLEKGPIGCAVHFDLGPSRAGRVLLVLHHLVVDGVSWRVLREDLESAYEQLGDVGRGTASVEDEQLRGVECGADCGRGVRRAER